MNQVPTEARIKQAALKEFAAYGFEGARIDRIAQKARVNKAMIYYHFKSKESLYEAVLSIAYSTALQTIIKAIPADKDPMEQLEAIISEFIDFIRDLDKNFVKMMLREISSGGKYFKKLTLPNALLPMLKIIQDILNTGMRTGMFKDLVPHITFIQILGSIFFSNAIRVTLADTELGKMLFQKDFFDKFKINLLAIIKSGIMAG